MVLQNRLAPLTDKTSGPIEWWDSMKDLTKKADEEVLRYQKNARKASIGSTTWYLMTERKHLH